MNRIKELRLAKGLSQYKLAEMAATSQARIWQWENGYYIPTLLDMDLVARALGATMKEVFPDVQ
jgi:transcriptional regulator with XRE-family HTH domain